MEINHLLSLTESSALEVHDQDEALAKFRFWLDTPKGQCWGNAKWGNNLELFKHEPVDETTEVAMENSIITDLPVDIPSLSVKGIRVEMLDTDAINVIIDTNFGLLDGRL